MINIDNYKYEREDLEWKLIEETQLPKCYVSNYGDIYIEGYEKYDKANRHFIFPSKVLWSEEQPKSGGGQDKRNYRYLHLPNQKREYAHRYVAKAFIPNPDNLPQVNHKDGCHTNNHVSNLEWVSAKQNGEHASRTGLINRTSEKRKEACKINRLKALEASRRKVVALTLDGEYVAEYDSITEASQIHNVCHSTIQEVASHDGYHRTAKGLQWVYKDEYDPNKNYKYEIQMGKSACRPVIQYDMDMNFIAEYESIQDACRKTGFNGSSYIGEVCMNKRKMYKNYIWRYKDCV